MKLSDNFMKIFSVSDIQFCLGIAVSNAGYNQYATQIIEYRTHKYYNAHNDITSNPALRMKFQQAREDLENRINALAESEKCSHDYAAIKWFFTEPFLKESRANSSHANTGTTSLERVLGRSYLEKMYSDVMRMLYTTRKNALITWYIPTSLFKAPFKRALSKAIRDNIGHADVISRLSDSDFEILRADFAKIYERGLTTSSEPFFTETGDPNSALCGDPIQRWYVNNPNAEFQSVLFGRGQEIDTGDDSVSKLNLKDTEEELNTTSIDFIDLCTKIHKASSILFEHTGHLVYDIFSHHCDRMSNKQITDFRRSCENIYPGIQFNTSSSSIGECINDTHRGKIVDRLQYADFLDERFSHTVALSDLKVICNQLYKITENVKPDDGRRLFEVDGHRVYQVTNESQRFEALLNGYTAMYELIDYINKNESRTGISLNDFPVTIFRDSMYLKRFRTFDEYIEGHDIVMKLIDEVKQSDDSSRRKDKFNGFYNNESVDDIFAANSTIRYITEFSILGDKHVSFLSEITHKKRVISMDEELAEKIYDSSLNLVSNPVFYSTYPFITENLNGSDLVSMREMSYAQCIYMIQEMALANKEILDQRAETGTVYCDETYYAYAIQFLYILTRVQEMEMHPVSDTEGFFSFSLDSMKEGIAWAAEHFDELVAEEDRETVASSMKNTLVFRMVNLIMCYNTFFDENLSLKDIKDLTEEDINNIFYAYGVLKCYIDKAYNLRYRLSRMALKSTGAEAKRLLANSMFSIATDLVDDMDFLSIPSHVRSSFDWGCLCTKGMDLYMDRDLLSGDKEASRRLHARDVRLVEAFNHMLDIFSESVDIFKSLKDGVQAKLGSASKEMDSTQNNLYDKMETLDREILCNNYLDTDECYRHSQIVQAVSGHFNQYGFLIKDGAPVSCDYELYKRYYHKRGVACNIYKDIDKIEQINLTDDDVRFLQSL